MLNLNKVIVAGRLTKNPEIKSMPNGTKVATFGVATNRYYKDTNGERKEAVEYVNCVAFSKTAEFVGKYFFQGKGIYLEGRMQTRNWKNDVGVTLYRTEVLLETFPQFIDSAKAQSNPDNQESNYKEDEVQIGETGKKVEVDYGDEINPEDIPF